MFRGLTPHLQFVLLTLTLAAAAVLVAYVFSVPAAILVSVVLVAVLVLLRPLFMPPGWGATKVRLFTLAIGLSIASYGAWVDVLNAALMAAASSNWFSEFAPWLAQLRLPSDLSTQKLLVLLGVIYIANRGLASASGDSDHTRAIEHQQQSAEWVAGIDALRCMSKNDLESADEQTGWHWDSYMPLEFQPASPLSEAFWRRSTSDLVAYLLNDDSHLILLSGPGGSGKTIALRKLAYVQLERKERIPVCINLRSWRACIGMAGAESSGAKWSESNPPTIAHLERFVIHSIKSRGNRFLAAFIDEHFHELCHRGCLYFIFDGFDEIADLLDAPDDSWLVDALSRTISQFIKAHPQGRGILASQMVRQPTKALLADQTLQVLPFSDERVCKALARFPSFTNELRSELFRKRTDLASLARNPLMLGLLGAWIDKHGTLPAMQASLYEDYIRRRLGEAARSLREHTATEQDLRNGARDIALYIFRSTEYGLEMPVKALDHAGVTPHASAALEALKRARLARVSGGSAPMFAFAHARFLEYFVATALVADQIEVPLTDIPEGGRGREPLALYAQVCHLEQAERIAMFCWDHVGRHYDCPAARVWAIHCLRFLIDAFRSRPEAMRAFRKMLGYLISGLLARSTDVLLAKTALEAAPMLPARTAALSLLNGIHHEDPWVRVTAFRTSRQLPRVNRLLQLALTKYVMDLPFRQFWKMRRSLLFSLSLSDALAPTRRVVLWRAWGTVATYALPIVAIATAVLLRMGAVAIVCGYLFFGYLKHPMVHRAFSTAIALDLKPGVRIVAPIALILGATGFALWPWQLAEGVALLVLSLTLLLLATIVIYRWSDRRLGKAASYSARPSRPPDERPEDNSTPRPASGSESILLILLPVIAGGAGLVLLIVWLIDLAGPLTKRLVWGFFIMIVVLTMARMYLAEHKERRLVDKLRLPESMSREQIVDKLQSFRFESSQLHFIRRLAARQIALTGKWPPFLGAQLCSDRCASELAKLEEQRLNLDR